MFIYILERRNIPQNSMLMWWNDVRKLARLRASFLTPFFLVSGRKSVSMPSRSSDQLTMQKAPVLFYSEAFLRLERSRFIALRCRESYIKPACSHARSIVAQLRSRSSSGGCQPARTQRLRAATSIGRFSCRATIVARPLGVRPSIREPSTLQPKCSRQGCVRGL